jgi:hypothetical protein
MIAGHGDVCMCPECVRDDRRQMAEMEKRLEALEGLEAVLNNHQPPDDEKPK